MAGPHLSTICSTTIYVIQPTYRASDGRSLFAVQYRYYDPRASPRTLSYGIGGSHNESLLDGEHKRRASLPYVFPKRTLVTHTLSLVRQGVILPLVNYTPFYYGTIVLSPYQASINFLFSCNSIRPSSWMASLAVLTSLSTLLPSLSLTANAIPGGLNINMWTMLSGLGGL